MTGSNPPAAIRRLRADVSEPCRRRPVPAVSQIEHLEPREVFERKPPAAVREVEYGDDFIPMHQHVRVAEAPRQEWSVLSGLRSRFDVLQSGISGLVERSGIG